MDTWDAAPRLSLLAADEELAASLGPADFARAHVACRVRTLRIERSRRGWLPEVDSELDADEVVRLLVVRGLLSQRMLVGDGHAVELLGPGDLFRPSVGGGERLLFAQSGWVVHEATVIALLDRQFFTRAAPWPAVGAALIDRAAGRSRALLARLAIAGIPLVSRRVHLVLWHLADRWGRIAPGGVILPMRLSRTLLGELVCARRESVSRALTTLAARDLVRQHPDGYLLRGPSPAPPPSCVGALTSKA